jgi:hypothetical protein
VAELVLDHREHELVAVGEVQVDRRWGDPDRLGDRPDREGRLVAGGDQQPLGGIEDLGAQPLTLAPAGSRPPG